MDPITGEPTALYDATAHHHHHPHVESSSKRAGLLAGHEEDMAYGEPLFHSDEDDNGPGDPIGDPGALPLRLRACLPRPHNAGRTAMSVVCSAARGDRVRCWAAPPIPPARTRPPVPADLHVLPQCCCAALGRRTLQFGRVLFGLSVAVAIACLALQISSAVPSPDDGTGGGASNSTNATSVGYRVLSPW